MFPLTYYELFELLHIAGVFKGLGGQLGSFARSIRVRFDGYQRAWDELERSNQRIDSVTKKLAEQFHLKVPKSFRVACQIETQEYVGVAQTIRLRGW